MKKSSIYQLSLNNLILSFFAFLLICCSTKKIDENNIIKTSIIKKQKIDENNLIITFSFKNNSKNNYIIPNYLGYYLVHTMKENRMYDAPGKVRGKIISSEFSDTLDEKYLKLFYLYYSNTFYKDDQCNKLSDFNNFNNLTYTSSLLLLPHNSERKITLVFNANKFNRETFHDKNARISLSLDLAHNFKILDSLLKKEKINYKIYDRDILLKDSLFINK